MNRTDQGRPSDEQLTHDLNRAHRHLQMVAPIEEIQRRGRAYLRRRWSAAGAGLAVVVMLASVAIAGWPNRGATPVATPQPPFPTAEIDRGCQKTWDEMVADLPIDGGPPKLVMTLINGDEGLRVYRNDVLLLSCTFNTHGVGGSSGLGRPAAPNVGGPGEMLEWGTGSQSSYRSGEIVGAAPPGTVRIEIRTTSGSILPSRLADSTFGAYVATAQVDQLAQITAYTTDGAVVVRTRKVRPNNEAEFSAGCINDIALTLTTAKLDAEFPQPSLRFSYFDSHHKFQIYADTGAFAVCTPDSIRMWLSRANSSSLLSGHNEPTLVDGWVAGQAPVGTESVEILLEDRRSIPATLNGVWYAAAWNGATRIVRVVATTASQRYILEGGVITSTPL